MKTPHEIVSLIHAYMNDKKNMGARIQSEELVRQYAQQVANEAIEKVRKVNKEEHKKHSVINTELFNQLFMGIETTLNHVQKEVEEILTHKTKQTES
jgi:hypothetical protein